MCGQTDSHCHVTRSPHFHGSTALVLDDDEDNVGGYDNDNEEINSSFAHLFVFFRKPNIPSVQPRGLRRFQRFRNI